MGRKGEVLLVSADKYLAQELKGSLEGRGYALRIVPAVIDAAAELGFGEVKAILLDMGAVSASEAESLGRIHAQRGTFGLFLLKPLSVLSPNESALLRAAPWPLPVSFLDQVRASSRPVVFLVDEPLFVAGAPQAALKDAGIAPVVLEATVGLPEFVAGLKAPIAAPKTQSTWRSFVGISEKASQEKDQGLGHVVLALHKAGEAEAEALDCLVRRLSPEAVCYRVLSADPLVSAVKALREKAPVRLARESAGKIPAILDAAALGEESVAGAKRPVLVVDRDKASLGACAQVLLEAGCHVDVAREGAQALELARTSGSYHVAVIGTSFSSAQETGRGLAERLRAQDGDLRFVFLMDRYPLEKALEEVSRLIEWGADDAQLKPVESAKLVASVQRSLKRRALDSGAAAPPPGAPGKLLGGKYETLSQIGEGGMGVVFKAYDHNLDRFVAIKRMRPELATDPETRRKFIAEAKMISQVSHPLIVGIHEILEQDGQLYLVFDFVNGRALSEILRERKRLPFKECLDIFGHVCHAVETAHRKRILHRDLKPSNIMIDKGGYVKVMDFGLARKTKDSDPKGGEEVSGTLAYMAPEQHMGESGPASDVYSLGVCLYEMLTGEIPFKGPDFLAQKERRRYVPPNFLAPNIPAGVEGLMAAVLEPEPARRTPGAMAFLKLLKDL